MYVILSVVVVFVVGMIVVILLRIGLLKLDKVQTLLTEIRDKLGK